MLDDKRYRYEKQMANVEHYVLHSIKEKGVYISMKELNKILETLHEWRVID